MSNPFLESKLYAYVEKMQKEEKIPPRKWDGEVVCYEEENRRIEKKAAEILRQEGNMEIWQILEGIEIYLNSDIAASLVSEHEVVRMFAVLDRRVGKRTMEKIKAQAKEQPKWLCFFYNLRIAAEENEKKSI